MLPQADGDLGSTWGCFDDFRMRGVTAQMARKGDADQMSDSQMSHYSCSRFLFAASSFSALGSIEESGPK